MTIRKQTTSNSQEYKDCLGWHCCKTWLLWLMWPSTQCIEKDVKAKGYQRIPSQRRFTIICSIFKLRKNRILPLPKSLLLWAKMRHSINIKKKLWAKVEIDTSRNQQNNFQYHLYVQSFLCSSLIWGSNSNLLLLMWGQQR